MTAEQFDEPLLDADEAAQLLNVPRSSLYELVRSRGLPHVRIGKRGLRFTRGGLKAWVDENTYGVTAKPNLAEDSARGAT